MTIRCNLCDLFLHWVDKQKKICADKNYLLILHALPFLNHPFDEFKNDGMKCLFLIKI